MKAIVITGAMGALGTRLVKLLNGSGEDSLVILNDLRFPDTKLNPEKPECVEFELSINRLHNVRLISGDLNKPSVFSILENVLKKRKITSGYIINAAASLKLSSPKSGIFEVNAELPAKLQTLAQDHGMKLIQISSCSIYKQGVGINEEGKVEPTSTYEESKLVADRALLFRDKGEVIIIRPGLIYGGGTRHLGSAVAAIPVVLKSVYLDKIPRVRGGPKTNWIHVEDLARAVLLAANKEKPCHKIYNIVEEKPLTFGDTISHVCNLSEVKTGLIPIFIPGGKYFKRYINKILKRDITFELLNRAIQTFWKRTLVADTSKLNLYLEKEMCTYLEGDMVFSSDRFRGEFGNSWNRYCQWPAKQSLDKSWSTRKFKDGWNEAIEWYDWNDWV